MGYRIRLLTTQDCDAIQRYLDKDPLYNVYSIHGLQTLGLDSQRAKFWGAFQRDRLVGVLFTDVMFPGKHSPRWGCLAGDDPKVLARLGRFSLKDRVKIIRGKSTSVQPAVDALASRVKRLYLTHWNFYKAARPVEVPVCNDYPVRVATREDIPALVELYKDFEYGSRDLRHIEFEIQNAVDRSTCFFIELEGRVVSASMIVAETDRAGMMNYARTLPEFRKRGLHLCIRVTCYKYLFGQGKIALGAFSDSNTAMHRIISKNGSIIGKWVTAAVSRKPPLRRRLLPKGIRRLGLSLKNEIFR